jgi:hypothetical protein
MRCPDLLESELGIGMDPPAEFQNVGAAGCNFSLDFFG